MAEPKTYTAQEAAIAVLKKAEEILKKSELMKAEKGVHAAVNQKAPGDSMAGMAASYGHRKESGPSEKRHAATNKSIELHKEKLAELKDMPKPNLTKAENKAAPSNPMKPEIKQKPTERDFNDFETKPGHAAAPDHRQATQTPPGSNPKEQAEGNNPEAGMIPLRKGVHKLMHFAGRMDGKKSMNKALTASEPDMARSEGSLPNVKKGIALS